MLSSCKMHFSINCVQWALPFNTQIDSDVILASVVEHNTMATRGSSCNVKSRVLVDVGDLASTESVLTLGVHVQKLSCTFLRSGVLVSHSWLHHLRKSLALSAKSVNGVVLPLQSILQVLHHARFNFLKLLDSPLIGLTQLRMLKRTLRVLVGYIGVVGLPVLLRVHPVVLVVGEAMIGHGLAVLLVTHLRIHLVRHDLLRVLLCVLSRLRVLIEHCVLVSLD